MISRQARANPLPTNNSMGDPELAYDPRPRTRLPTPAQHQRCASSMIVSPTPCIFFLRSIKPAIRWFLKRSASMRSPGRYRRALAAGTRRAHAGGDAFELLDDVFGYAQGNAGHGARFGWHPQVSTFGCKPREVDIYAGYMRHSIPQ